MVQFNIQPKKKLREEITGIHAADNGERDRYSKQVMLWFVCVSELSQVQLSLWKAIYVPNDIKSHTSCTIQKYGTIGAIVVNVWHTFKARWFSMRAHGRPGWKCVEGERDAIWYFIGTTKQISKTSVRTEWNIKSKRKCPHNDILISIRMHYVCIFKMQTQMK